MKTSIKNMPVAVGPYRLAIRTDKTIFVSGQLGLNPETGELAEGMAGQVEQSLTNIKHILEASGSSMLDVVKTTIFTTDLSQMQTINEIYAQFFSNKVQPARSCVQVSALPKGGLVEIECVAMLDF